jgi:F-type H+-transporting ATPase subunit delta
MQACIGNPNLGAKQLYDLFVALCKQDFPAEARNFVRVLIANGRLGLLPEIYAQFAELKNERDGVLEAEIRSAFPLENAQITALVADVSRRFKRRVQPRVTVDKDLIGGVHIKVGDEVIDGSVRGKLESMATALKG